MERNGQRQSEATLPEHLMPFFDGQWAVWKCAGLRGAGFPVATVLNLGVPALALKADQLMVAESETDRAKSVLMKAVNGALDELKRNDEWDNSDKLRPLLNARSSIKANKPPNDMVISGLDLSAYSLRFANARAKTQVLQQQFQQQYGASVQQVSKAIREIATSERFREAMLWQNRQALHTAIDPLLRKPLKGSCRSSKQRQYESLIASYLQRYSIKNDTIGFFGPVGWAEFVGEGAALSVRPGESLVEARKTYFEVWGIEALAKQIAGTSAAKPWLKPIRLPLVRIDGTTLHHPFFGAIKIPAVQAAILTACKGERTAREIAHVAMRWPSSGIKSEQQVYELLEQMVSKGLILYGFNIPLNPFPERVLRESFDQLGDDELRREALTALDELEHARGAVAAAAGDAEKLDAALEQLEKTFTRLTDTPATRSHGKTYAARTLVYEDCRRNIEVQLGPDVLKAMEEPLSLLLMSARWLTTKFAEAYREKLKNIYDDLVRSSNSTMVDPVKFWLQVMPLVFGSRPEIKETTLREFSRRWDNILSVDLNERRVCLTAEDLRAKVMAEFFTPKSGWKGACYNSPDIMIAAPSVEAVNRSEYQLVMGEFHVASNTLASSLFFHQHPHPESLIQATRYDTPGLKVVPVTPKDFTGITARTMYALIQPDDLQLEFTSDSFALRRSQALPIASLLIEEKDGELIARTRNDSLRFEVAELVGTCLNLLILDSFRIFTAHTHTPRISIDRLVISRETWRFPAHELSFAFEKPEANRFLAARRWARAHELPRFVFVKLPVEVKPCFVDFDSPVYVDIFSKLVRLTVETGGNELMINVSEMLPGPEQIWLVDADGQRYTSEFRIVIVDLA